MYYVTSWNQKFWYGTFFLQKKWWIEEFFRSAVKGISLTKACFLFCANWTYLPWAGVSCPTPLPPLHPFPLVYIPGMKYNLQNYFRSSKSKRDLSSAQLAISTLSEIKKRSPMKTLKYKNTECNWTRTQNHLVHKRTLHHLAKQAKRLGVRLRIKWFWVRV